MEMKRCLIVVCTVVAWTLPATAMPIASPSDLGAADAASVMEVRGHGHGHGHHHGWGRGHGHHYGWWQGRHHGWH